MAYTSPNMGLRVWNLSADPYDHDQLADNMARIDFHDHSPGRGHQIPTEAFIDASITSAKLSNTATVKGVGSFSAYRNAALAGVANDTEIVWDTEEWDLSNWFDVGNGRFTPQVAGYYRVSALITTATDIVASGWYEVAFAKNGSAVKFGPRHAQPAASPSVASFRAGGTAVIACNGTTDFLSIKTSSSAAIDVTTGASQSFFQGELVGRS